MAAAYLIDGYNLIHALGLLRGRAGPGELERARKGLLGLLHGTFGDASPSLTVVFDASRAPRRAQPEQRHLGIHVRFAPRGQTADDVIECLLEESSDPAHLTVISSDHRLQEAARRRGARALACTAFMDSLLDRRNEERRRRSERADDRPAPSEEETRRWLEVFSGLNDDPAFKELFDRFGLSEEDFA